MDVLNIVLPVFLVSGLGFGLRKADFLDGSISAAITSTIGHFLKP